LPLDFLLSLLFEEGLFFSAKILNGQLIMINLFLHHGCILLKVVIFFLHFV
jgi:hypothetical protein